MDATLLVSAALSGLAVVLVTYLAGRLGGTVGGLLATAPVTTTAALLYYGLDAGNGAAAHAALQGGRALTAALWAMPAYFHILRVSRGGALPVRLALAVTAFLAVFTGGTLALSQIPLPDLAWLLVALATAAFLGLTFLPLRIDAARARSAKTGMRWYEVPLRFLAGAAVVLLVGGRRASSPLLAAAWTVFPGTFVVTLLVMGVERGAAWSARAAQGGVLGVPPLAAYLLTLYLLLPLSDHAAWPWLAQVPAWLAYFAALVPLWRWRQGSLARAAAPHPGAPAKAHF